MGCAESRNTVQPHGVFSVVTSGSNTNTTTTASSSTAITTSGSRFFFHRNSNNGGPATQKKHKPNALVPEPQGPTAPPEIAARASPPSSSTPSGPAIPPGSSSPPPPNARSTSPSVAAIANAKPSPSTSPYLPSSSSSSPPTLAKGPSLQLLPSDKQNLTHLTLEELSIQFLKAVKNGDLAYMERVAQQAAKAKTYPINIRGMWESTPLIYACQYCRPKAAMWLLEHDANVHLQNEKGVTPLLLASLEGMTDVVDWILKQYADHVTGDSVTPLLETGADAAVAIVSIDKQAGVVYNSVADLNIRLNPLLAAAMNGHVDIVAKLLAHKASVNCGVPASASVASSKQFALLLAAKYGHASVVRILIEHGADFATSDTTGNHALLLACEASKEECAMELLRLLPATPAAVSVSSSVNQETEADKVQSPSSVPTRPNSFVAAWKQANSHGLTALHFAAANGLFSVVQSMVVCLRWGDDREFLNATSVSRRECALLMTCRKRQSEVAQLLVSVGADFELADRGGTTALQVLKRDKKDELVKLCESRKLGGGGGGGQQQQQQQLQSSRTASVRGGAMQAKGSGKGHIEKHEEESSTDSAGHSVNETSMMTELAIDVTENHEMLLDSHQPQQSGGSGDGEKTNDPAPKFEERWTVPTAAEIAKPATQFDWDAGLKPVISTTTTTVLIGGDDSDGSPALLAREPSSRLKSMAMSGSSRTMPFSPNVIPAPTSGCGQKQRDAQEEEAEPDLEAASSCSDGDSPLTEDKNAERIKTSAANPSDVEKAADPGEAEKPSEPVVKKKEQTATNTESAEPTSLEAPRGDAEEDEEESSHRKKELLPSFSKPKHRKKEHSPKKTKRKDAADEDDITGSFSAASTPGVTSRVNGVEGLEEGRTAAAAFSFSHETLSHTQDHSTPDDGDSAWMKKTQSLDTTGGISSVLKTAPALEPLPSQPTITPVESEDALPPSSPKKERRKKKPGHNSKKSKQSVMMSASSSSLGLHTESTSSSHVSTITTSSAPPPETLVAAATAELSDAPAAALEGDV